MTLKTRLKRLERSTLELRREHPAVVNEEARAAREADKTLAAIEAVLIAAGDLANEVVQRFRLLCKDEVPALPEIVWRVRDAIDMGWKPVPLGERWTRLALDPPKCWIIYHRCAGCQAPLPAVPDGMWHRPGGGSWQSPMTWFANCPGCGREGPEPRYKFLPRGQADGVEWCFRYREHGSTESLWIPHAPDLPTA